MALKDWKKLGSGEMNHIWVNIRKEWDSLDEPIVDVRQVYRDRVEMFGETREKIHKIFSSEKQALRFAKNYMKIH